MRLINVYSTVRELPALEFNHRLLGARDRTDSELAEHLQGFVGFIFQDERPMTFTRYHVMRHLERVRHHLSIEMEDDALDDFSLWAHRANAICFMTDGTVRDPEGLVLVDPETGEVEQNATVPFPHNSYVRKEKSERKISDLGISLAKTLPPILGEEEVEFRSPRLVAERAYALLAVALRAESLATAEPIPVEDIEARLPLAFGAFTPRETAFMQNSNPSREEIIDFTWQYEALFLLEWALGMTTDLPLPDKICDVSWTAKAILQNKSEVWIRQAKLRSAAEILDALDLTYRLHWHVREARRTQQSPAGNLDAGVLQERHHALNWLIHFENAEWDEVDTPT